VTVSFPFVSDVWVETLLADVSTAFQKLVDLEAMLDCSGETSLTPWPSASSVRPGAGVYNGGIECRTRNLGRGDRF
jgi:hypothetical protein